MARSNKKDELISLEEGRSNITVNLQQATPGQTENRRHPSDTNIQCESLRNRLQSMEDAVISKDTQENGKPKAGQRPKIQKASNKLWGDEMEKYFEPLMISFGPLHHGDKFKLAEKLKVQLAARFILEHQLDKVHLYNKINELIDILRKFYIEEDIETFNNEDLAWMFLVDGCALLHYIECCDSKEKLRELKIKMDTEAFAQQDLFLLENQLPYQLLDRVLIKSIADHKDQDAVRVSISKFVDKIARNIRGPSDDVEDSLGKSIQRIIRQRQRPLSSPRQSPPNTDPAHLLELLWRDLVGYETLSQNLHSYYIRYTIRSASELKAAWIRFKSNTSGSLMDVAFDPRWFIGTLSLPSLTVDDSTKPMFLNLIAFEMCPDFENDFPVSSYISFLDSLIDEADDVKVLRNAHILYNALGSDKQVASLFNKIGSTDIVHNPETYGRVKYGIQRHYGKKWGTWIWLGHSFHDQFSSPPWKILAFAGAIIALFLSAVQTWFTVYSR